MPLHVSLWVSDVHFDEVLFWDDLEEEAEDTSSELSVLVFTFGVQKMDDVHFEIHELTIDGVFTWSMEVELDTMESSDWDVWVKE